MQVSRKHVADLQEEKNPFTFSHSPGNSMRFTFARKMKGIARNSSVEMSTIAQWNRFAVPVSHRCQVYLCR